MWRSALVSYTIFYTVEAFITCSAVVIPAIHTSATLSPGSGEAALCDLLYLCSSWSAVCLDSCFRNQLPPARQRTSSEQSSHMPDMASTGAPYHSRIQCSGSILVWPERPLTTFMNY